MERLTALALDLARRWDRPADELALEDEDPEVEAALTSSEV